MSYDGGSREPLSNSQTTTSSALGNQEYTVGWISALPLELAAARAMLDEYHGRPHGQHKSDQNVYMLGRIGQHNIVLTCLPAKVYGAASAATVAAHLLSSFESIRFSLVVGIGGGVPSDLNDIRLGDVVVSKPQRTLGGVVQYDYGKTIEGGEFIRTGALNKPPPILLNAIAGLEIKHMAEGNMITQFVSEMFTKYPRMKTDFSYPGELNDQLYQADYDHVGHSKTCKDCNASMVLERSGRPTTAPLVHYGIIASGNQVMKHGITRDRLSEELNMLCFEMEAAGLIDNLPCLVVRGISDYADSHKNNRWQGYAAATAAAYAKELLSIIPARKVKKIPLVDEAIKSMSSLHKGLQLYQDGGHYLTVYVAFENVAKIGGEVTRINVTPSSVQRDNDNREVLGWLSGTNHAAQCSDFLCRRQEGTGLLVLKSLELNEWLAGARTTIFCPGIHGSGKTMMASIVVEHLWKTFPPNSFLDHKTGIAVLYCSYKMAEELRDVDLLSSILKQLAEIQQSTPESVKSLYNLHKSRQTRPSFDEVSKSLLTVLEYYSQVFIVIDAIDEFGDDDCTRMRILSTIRNLQTQFNVKLMVTSRFYPKIEQEFKTCIQWQVRASNEDVALYLDSQMPRMPSCVSQRPYLQQRIKAAITGAADGIFLLARLHLDSLIYKPTEKAITSSLQRLPRGSDALNKAYEEVQKRIDYQPPEFLDLAKRVFSWLLYAQRPLTVMELQHALAIERGAAGLDETNIPGVDEMISACAGLVVIDPENCIIRFVHCTTHEYFERVGPTWIPNATADIAMACLTYLSFETFASGYSPSDVEFKERLEQNVFLRYASTYWANHVRDVQAEVIEVALPFLNNTSLTSASNQAAVELSFRYYGYSQGWQQNGLHLAARFGLQMFVEVLFEDTEGAVDIESKDDYDRTPLLWAASEGHEGIVRLLLEKAAGIDVKDRQGQTPLSRAAENGHIAILRLLLEKGVDIGSVNIYIQTPLSLVAEGGHEEVVKVLIEKGADTRSVDLFGRTPLSWAAEMGWEAVVRLLLEKGADTGSVDRSGQTPLSLAMKNGHEEIAKLLQPTTSNP